MCPFEPLAMLLTRSLILCKLAASSVLQTWTLRCLCCPAKVMHSYAMLIHVVYPSPFQQLSCVSPGAVPRCFFRPPRCSQTQGQRCWHVEGRVEGELGTHCPLRRMRAAGKWIVSFCLYIRVCCVLVSTST